MIGTGFAHLVAERKLLRLLLELFHPDVVFGLCLLGRALLVLDGGLRATVMI